MKFRHLLFLLVVSSFFSQGCSKDKNPVSTSGNNEMEEYDYSTTVVEVKSERIIHNVGGTIEVTQAGSGLEGLVLDIPANALSQDTTITIGVVNNPPELPAGEQYVGASIDFGPNGLIMNKSLQVQIAYTEAALSDAGISDDTALHLYVFNENTQEWEQVMIQSIDRDNNILYAQIDHFSYYAITGFGGTPPENIGTPHPGDLLYKLSFEGWRPGHVGIYTGEKNYPGNGLASTDVITYGKYNVIEALEDGVQYSYYDIPNVTEEFEEQLGSFSHNDVFMGSREPADLTLSEAQRIAVVSYVEAQIGKPYAWAQTAGVLFGMLRGSLVKGPLSFNCVGLAEKAYEEAGVNDGEGLTTFWQEEFGLGIPPALTPAEHYNQTRPASGSEELPVIEWASLTPDHGSEYTIILAQIAVSHVYGLDYISGVTYVTDDGYTNPNIYINDEGIDGDIMAGDGVYSAAAGAGGDVSMGTMALNFTVTDVMGNAAHVRLVYTYDSAGGPAVSENLEARMAITWSKR